jgi:Cu(I)/Ag(I) efflux system membrane fusion protein
MQAARQRLALLGMSEQEIASIERAERVRQRFTRYAPISGVIAELGVREGMAVMPGHTLFRIVDLSTVWVNAEIPETQAAAVVPGSRAEARVAAYPDTKFEGRVGALLPEINPATRTIRARIELANPGERLKPGMFATLSFVAGRGKEMLLVPTEAIIRTGERSIVIVSQGKGRFSPQEVDVGAEHGGMSEIRKGLGAGATVVLSGQFLIDSEASLSGAVARLAATPEAPAKDGGHKGRGKVTRVDPQKGSVELDHEPIASMQWPAMKMGFMVADKRELAALKPGDVVEFELAAKPDQDGNYVISRIGSAK